jgi:hypothetical protein
MITQNNYIYSQAALARVLEISPKSIIRFEVWDKVIFVIIKGKRPTFISKNLLKKEFTNFREFNSKSVNIIPHAVSDKLFLAQSRSEKAKKHSLEIYETFDGLIKARCSCDDYKNQGEYRLYLKRELGGLFDPFNRKCKHLIALESFLGGSLTDYINELKAIEEEYKYTQAKADLFGDYAAY